MGGVQGFDSCFFFFFLFLLISPGRAGLTFLYLRVNNICTNYPMLSTIGQCSSKDPGGEGLEINRSDTPHEENHWR